MTRMMTTTDDDDDYQSLMQTDDATPSLPRRTQFPHARVFSYLCICHLVTSLFSLTLKRANILLKWSLSYICGVTAIQTRYGVRSLGLPLSFLFSGSMIMNAIRHPGRKEPLPPSLPYPSHSRCPRCAMCTSTPCPSLFCCSHLCRRHGRT